MYVEELKMDLNDDSVVSLGGTWLDDSKCKTFVFESQRFLICFR